MADGVKKDGDLHVDRVRRYLEETIAGMVAASTQLPQIPANLPFFAQIGSNILALEAILRHLPR